MTNAGRRDGRAELLVGLCCTGLCLTTFGMEAMGGFSGRLLHSNSAATGTVVLRVATAATTCRSLDGTTINTNAAACTIDLYGSATLMAPGVAPVTTSFTVTHDGTTTAPKLTLTGGTCVSSGAGGTYTPAGTADLCKGLSVTLSCDGKQVYSGTAAGLTSTVDVLSAMARGPLAPGQSLACTSSTSLAGTNKGWQNQKVSQPLTWTLSA